MINISIKPNDRQKLFFLSDCRYVLYGGARGGGKSWAVRKKAMLLGINYPGIKMLIIRRTFPELETNHITPLKEELNGIAKYKERNKTFYFNENQGKQSIIVAGYCATDSDVLQYQGQEYDVLFIDEATQLSEYQFNTLKAVVRGVNDFPKRTYLTANPGGPGHNWVKRLFIDRLFHPNEHPEDYTFIPAKAQDNYALMEAQPDYIDQLRSLPEDLRRAWLDGDWDVYAGQFFTEFDRNIHVMKPFVIPPEWQRYCTMDYGLDMFAAYWIAVDQNGREYVYKEIHKPNMVVSEAAKYLKSVDDPETLIYFAPPDMWSRRNDTGRSVAEIFTDFGIYLSRAKADRHTGWIDVKEHLHPGFDEMGNKVAGLRIFANCKNLIHDIPLAQFDETDPDDMSKDPHEITHSLDAIRYFCTGRQIPMLSSEIHEEDDYDREIDSFLSYGGQYAM